MTRTQKLNLFTWELSDPVSLAQMNENFDLLDINAARTEAALWNSTLCLLAAAHAGQNVSLSESSSVDTLANTNKVASYSHLAFGSQGARLLSTGFSGSSGNLNRLSIAKNEETTLCSFQPEGYGQMTKFTIAGIHAYGSGSTLRVRIYSGNTLAAENQINFAPADANFSQEFSFNLQMDPNSEYRITINQLTDSTLGSIQLDSWSVTASPQVYSAGNFLTEAIPVSAGTTRMRLMCGGSSTAPTVSLSEDGGAFTAVSLSQAAGDGADTYTGQAAITAETEQVQLKFEISGTGAGVRDYVVIFI